MIKEDLIKKLQELPDGIEICVFDWKRNFLESDGDGTSAGIYQHFDIEVLTEDQIIDGIQPFAVISFENTFVDIEQEENGE